jgi:recombination protein RecA
MSKKDFESALEKYSEYIARRDDSFRVFETGSFSLNLLLKVGGIPSGRFTEIFGPEGVGKTTLALSIAKSVIDRGGKVLYVEPENSMTFSYVEKVVGNTDNFVLIQPPIAQDALEICGAGISDKYDLVVLDSIGSLVPEEVTKKELTDRTVALLAHYMTIFIQKYAYLVKANDVAVLLLNQVRDNLQQSFIKSYSTPGGHALKHMASLIISLTRDEKISDGGDVVGVYSKFSIVKSKLGPPFLSSRFPIIFNSDKDYPFIHYGLDLLNFALLLGVVTNKRGYFYIGDERLDAVGTLNVANMLMEDKETLDKIKDLVYNKYELLSRTFKQGADNED